MALQQLLYCAVTAVAWGVQGKLVAEAARQTEGFSGRELAKLTASVQAAAYGTPNAKLSEEVRPAHAYCYEPAGVLFRNRKRNPDCLRLQPR